MSFGYAPSKSRTPQLNELSRGPGLDPVLHSDAYGSSVISSEGLEVRGRRAMRPAECPDVDAAVGLNSGRVAREFSGTTMIAVPSGLVHGPRALIDLLETEAR
jgi:hypothetical protein